MTLIVEDGSLVPGAESYCSVADADAYHAGRANSAWAALDTPTKEANLRKATEYMVGMYRPRWKGLRSILTQTLDWPRYNVQLEDVGFGCIAAYVLPNTVPAEVKNACAALALTANGGDLAPNITRVVKQKTIGPITTIYQDGAPTYTQYRAIDLMLRPYLEPKLQMVRA
jgi:hypothetical protein